DGSRTCRRCDGSPVTLCDRCFCSRRPNQPDEEMTMTTEFVDVDVRPILRAGGEPFSAIMQAVEGLEPGQGVRLFATFKPIPLFGVMGSRGFSHEAIELDDGEWEVLFRPAGTGLTPPPVSQGGT